MHVTACVQGRLWGKPEPLLSIVIAASRVHFRTHLMEITGNVLECIYSISSSASYLQTRNGRNYIIRGKPKTRAGCSTKALASPPTVVPKHWANWHRCEQPMASGVKVRERAQTNVPVMPVWTLQPSSPLIPSRIPDRTVTQETRKKVYKMATWIR